MTVQCDVASEAQTLDLWCIHIRIGIPWVLEKCIYGERVNSHNVGGLVHGGL